MFQERSYKSEFQQQAGMDESGMTPIQRNDQVASLQLPPIIKSLAGVLKQSGLDLEDYKKSLKEKYLK